MELKPAYDSESDDILNEFYIPVLSAAKTYHRLAGYFSSSALAVAARGISAFVRNGGDMRLIVGAKMQPSDIEAIRQGKEDAEGILSKQMLGALDDIEDAIIRDHVRALAWLVANKHLDIKVALVVDSSGRPMNYDAALRYGIFHQKVGILEDADGNTISFSGSVNETASAWEGNIEEFKVFRSWVEGEIQHLESDTGKFERYWYGNTSRLKIYDVPDAVRQKLVELAPDDIRSLRIDILDPNRVLRDYQQEAISRWLENSSRGIFEMATATGKTYAAIGCLLELKKRESSLAVVVTCPFTHLIEQWKRNLESFGIGCLEAFAGADRWEDKLANAVFDYNNRALDTLVVVTTHDTFSGQRFMQIMKSVTGKTVLIADEVHGLGSPERRYGLMDAYLFRLGLSATPTRWFDEEGTAVIMGFFDKVVFEFGLQDAINRGFLCPYEYQPRLVELTSDELEEYRELTKKIASEYTKVKDRSEQTKLFELYCILRHRITINALEKYTALESVLGELRQPKHCLIYCSPQQIDRVQEMLNRRNIVQHKFTAEEDAKDRKRLLTMFAEGHYKVLVAMKCLDEGVDVPSTRVAIIMASSTNPREFIQRRGRILRMAQHKDRALIYDFVTVPPAVEDPTLGQLESKILRSELQRYMEFARSATNGALAYAQIAEVASRYHIVLEE